VSADVMAPFAVTIVSAAPLASGSSTGECSGYYKKGRKDNDCDDFCHAVRIDPLMMGR